MKNTALAHLIRPAAPLRLGAELSPPILSMTMRDGLVDQADKFKKRVASADLSPYKVVTRGQLVVGFPIDEAVLAIQTQYERAVVSPAYAVWDIQDSLVEARYLEYFLRGPQAVAYYKARLQGSTARRRSLPNSVFLEMEVPLPPLPEQRRIVSILDQVDALLGERRLAILHLKRFMDSAFDAAFEQSSWPVESLGSLASTQGGITVSKAREAHPLKVDYLRVANVSRGNIDLSEVKSIGVSAAEVERTHLKIGDILIVEGHGNINELGRAARWADPGRSITHQNHLIRVRAIPGILRSEFLERYLNSRTARAYFRSVSKTTSGLNTLNMSNVKAAPVMVPPLAQQDEFVEMLVSAERVGEAQSRHLQKLDELFASLQHRAFAGSL